jgi:hypothetical protein
MCEQPQSEKRRSVLGTASCYVFGVGLLILIISRIGFAVLFARSAPVVEGFDAVLYVMSWGISLTLPPAHGVGVLLGLAGLLERDRRKEIAVIGALLNLAAIPFVVLYIYRFAVK